MKNILFLFFFLITQLCAAQSLKKMLKTADEMNTRVYAYEGTDKIIAHIYDEDKEIKTQDDKYYYWYAVHDIKKTKGAYSGKALHGEYMSFYQNKDLKAKGYFKKGLLDGRYATWHPNGEYLSLRHYKKGYQHGIYKLFDTTGVLLEEGEYKKDIRVGVFKKYHADGSILILKYKNGQVVHEKEKKSKRKIPFIKDKSPKDTLSNVNPSSPGTDKPTEKNKKEKKSKGKKQQIKIRRSIQVIPTDPGDQI
jgi:hypothetical protein